VPALAPGQRGEADDTWGECTHGGMGYLCCGFCAEFSKPSQVRKAITANNWQAIEELLCP